jgi:hypothetical protein
MSRAKTNVTFLDKDFLVEFDYTVTYGGCAARTYGPAEDCYPAEDMEYVIDGIDLYIDEGDKLKYVSIPDWLYEILHEMLMESQESYDIIRENEER